MQSSSEGDSSVRYLATITILLLLVTPALAQTDVAYKGVFTVPLRDTMANPKLRYQGAPKNEAKYRLTVHNKVDRRTEGKGRLVIEYQTETPGHYQDRVPVPEVRLSIAHDAAIVFGAPVERAIIAKPNQNDPAEPFHILRVTTDKTIPRSQLRRISWTKDKGFELIGMNFSGAEIRKALKKPAFGVGEETAGKTDERISQTTRRFGLLMEIRPKQRQILANSSTIGGEITCPYRIVQVGEFAGALFVQGFVYVGSGETEREVRGRIMNDQGQGVSIPLSWKVQLPPVPSKAPGSVDTRTVDLGGDAKMTLVWIKGGSFMMGSPKTEGWRSSNEDPIHKVTVDGFWIGQTEVTQAQYKTVMGKNPSRFTGDQNPVEEVSWQDAKSFCDRLSQQTGGAYRLPYEAEWEYACRAGTSTPFHTGATISTFQANFCGDYPYGRGRKGVDRQKTIAVKSFPPNTWGLYDMHGNVSEWCGDWYGKDYYGGSPSSNPKGPSGDRFRVLRGGAFYNDPGNCRSADRLRGGLTVKHHGYGFRVVCVSPGPK